MSLRPAVFLDRDGVLNQAYVDSGVPVPPRSLTDLHILPGVVEACRQLSEAGLALVVVTNQPDVSRGTLQRDDVDQIHAELRSVLPLDDICACLHDDADDCPCRKPRPGLILEAAERLGLDLNRSVGVGDRWRDVEAARNAGIRSVYIDWGLGEALRSAPDATFSSLLEATPHLVSTALSPSGDPTRTTRETTT